MSLNDNHMLPDRIRNMRQMHDVLTVEDIILAEMEGIIDDMYRRASLLHEELVNEAWLEARLSARTGAAVKATGDAERLLVSIVLSGNEAVVPDLRDIRDFLNKWLPAHLRYKLNDRMILAMECSILNRIKLISVSLHLKISFFPSRSYDGSKRYDGATRYDAKRRYEMDAMFRLRYRIRESESTIGGLTVETRRNMQYYNGKKHHDGTTKYNALLRKEVIE
ncbi:MAG: hypothetical protein NC331_16575 [Lachnospiraceae bacterium]|nr:hypothetical protein [Lachnospiraceae bacterium]MCM1240966.1 hypothetical protein [Lachnospiraceae bacterium]